MHNLSQKYSNALKKKVCHKICDQHCSTIKTAEKFNIPLKTLEKWITAYNKDPKCFNHQDNYYMVKRSIEARKYDRYTKSELIEELKRKDRMLEYYSSILAANDFENLEVINTE